jgi:hypothetical protein
MVSLGTVLGSAVSAFAGPENSVVVVAARIPDERPRPVVDGAVTEDVWGLAPPASHFIQQDPHEGQPATERTEVRVLFDRRAIYIGVICFDSEPDKIVVTQSRRDADLNDTDSIQVVLDTFNDNQNAFVFGTNPLGIEYDGQVAGEGQTGGTATRSGAAGSQRGQISGFNANWDGDWEVKAQITARGWEAELVIPFRTLRYRSGSDRVWGFNVMRNIRRKNEQVYLAPIPRGYDLYRVSLAAKLTGLDLPGRRDLKAIPFVSASLDRDYLRPDGTVERRADVGLDVKWGLTPTLTADFTLNTDFAQVEADEEQINLTRFPLFFPEKRPFFLENASMFQFGTPQEIDLFFSRRIGLASTGAAGVPIGIIGGARLTGRVGPVNVALLNIQTERTTDARTGTLVAPANNFGVVRLQRQVGRSSFGAIFVNRHASGETAGRARDNRAYGVDAVLQLTPNGKLFTFLARTDSPGTLGSDLAGRALYTYANPLFNGYVGVSAVGDRFNPEVGFLQRRGYVKPEGRFFLTYQPKRWAWIRRFSPHISQNQYYNLEGTLQSSRGHYHFFEIQPAQGGRFGLIVERLQDRPERPFTVFAGADGRRVVIPPDLYTWHQFWVEYVGDASAALYGTLRYKLGGFYDGSYRGFESQLAVRAGARFLVTVGWTRDAAALAYGRFATNLVPVKVNLSLTTRANLQALVQYNSQTAQLSSNIRLALLDRGGTGLFVVYNDRRETERLTPETLLGRSFVIKYTRLVDF